MRTIIGLCAALCLLVSAPARAADQAPGGPVIRHVPVTTAVRGVPVKLVCTIETSAILTQTVCLVRVTDVGPATELPLKGTGKGDYEAVVPIPLLEGVHVFWYSLTAYDANGRVTSTVWMRVRIIEGAAGSSHWFTKPVVWMTGGAIAAIGTVALLSGDDGDDPPPPPAPPQTTDEDDQDQRGSSGGSSSSQPPNENPPPPPPPPSGPPPCVLTGNESVSFFDLDYFSTAPITILVCGACSNATVRADATWSESVTVPNYNNPACSQGGMVLTLMKPTFPEPPTEESFTISVFSNGSLLQSILWPPPSD